MKPSEQLRVIHDSDGTAGYKAERCLEVAADLVPGHEAEAGLLLQAAQVYATLAIAEAYGQPPYTTGVEAGGTRIVGGRSVPV